MLSRTRTILLLFLVVIASGALFFAFSSTTSAHYSAFFCSVYGGHCTPDHDTGPPAYPTPYPTPAYPTPYPTPAYPYPTPEYPYPTPVAQTGSLSISGPTPAEYCLPGTGSPNSSSVTISWSTSPADSNARATASLDGGGEGIVGTGASGSKTYNLTSTGTYTVRLYSGTDSILETTSFQIKSKNCSPTPTASLSADQTHVSYNSSTTLRWSSTSATSCTASGDWSGSKLTSGSESTGNLTSSKTYSITCSGPGGTSPTASVPVTVGQQPEPPSGGGIIISSPADGTTVTTSLNVSGHGIGGLRVIGECGEKPPFKFVWEVGELIDPEYEVLGAFKQTNIDGLGYFWQTRAGEGGCGKKERYAYNFNIPIDVSSLSAGSYTLVVRATDGLEGKTVSDTLQFNKAQPADFSLSADPTTRGAEQGRSTLPYTIFASCTGSFTGPVEALSVTGLPSGASGSFSASKISCGGTVTLTISTSLTTPVGVYPLTISGTGTGVGTRTTSAQLEVRQAIPTASMTGISSGCSGSTGYLKTTFDYSNAERVELYRNNSKLADISLGAKEYTDSSVSSGSEYSYHIVASNTGAQTSSNKVSRTATWCVGDITVNARLDNNTWSGGLHYRSLGPSTVNGTSVPDLRSNLQNGSWNISFLSGGPSGASLSSITPASTQTLPGNVSSKPSITFTFNFTSNKPGAFSLSSSTSCSGSSPRIDLSWGSSTGATSYTVYRNGSLYANVGLSTSYTDSSVSSGTTYSYFIRASNTGGSTDSNTRSQQAYWCVGDITVNATLDGSSWSGGLNYRLLGSSTVNGNSVPGLHSNLQNGTWNLSYTSGGPSGASLSSITPSSSQTLPGDVSSKPSITFTFNFTTNKPGSFTLNSPSTSCSGSSPRINLSWGSSSNATSYTVFRNGSSYANVGLATSFTDTSVSSGTTYSYFIRASNAGGSTDSNTQGRTATWCVGDITVNSFKDGSQITGVSYTLFGPSNISGSTTGNHGSAQVGTWTIGNIGSPANTTLASITPSGTQTLPSGQTSKPAISYTLNFTTNIPSVPTGLSASYSCSSSSPRLNLSWNSSVNATGYKVFRNGSLYTDVGNTTSYTDTSVSSGTSYSYQVSAYNVGGESGKSGSVSETARWCVGDVTVNATLDGSSWSGTLSYKLLGPETRSGGSVSQTQSNILVGVYTLSLQSGGPSNSTLQSISPSSSQTLASGQTNKPSVTYTFVFTTNKPGSFTLNAPTTSCSGATPQITLSWGSSSNATSYTVFRNGASYANVGLATSYTDSSVSSGTTYSYFIRASNAGGTTDSNVRSQQAYWCVGDITVNATLDGGSWSGSVNYRLLGSSTINGSSVSATHSNLQNGTWNLSYTSGGPANSTLTSITPAGSQTLPGNVASKPNLTFTMNFATDKPGSFTLNPPTTTCYDPATPEIDLSWSAASNATSYSVYRNGAFLAVAGNTTSFRDFFSISSGTTYTYFIRATNAGGSTDSNSRSVTATWCVGDINVNATFNGSSWSGSLNYKILGPGPTINGSSVSTTHSNRENGTWSISFQGGGPSGSSLSSITPSGSQTLPGNVASKPSTTFTFNFTSNPPPPPTLDPPTTSCSGSSPRINLTWSSPSSSSPATSYTVFRNGSSYANVGLATSYTDTSVSSGTTYTYFIRASNAGGSTDSNTRSQAAYWCVGDINVNATFNGSAWSGSLKYRLLGPGPTVQGSSVATAHADRQNGTWTLDYQSGGPGASSLTSITPASSQTIPSNTSSKPTLSLTFNFTSTPPNTPSQLAANNTSQCERISLTWKDNSNNEQGFRVYRNQSGGFNLASYTQIGSVGTNAAAFTDQPPVPNDTYYYAVTAYNPGGESTLNSGSTVGPVFNVECVANVALSNKVVDKVNGTPYTGQTVKNDDVVTFKVIINNSGTAAAFDVYLDDTLSGNLVYQSGTASIQKGSGSKTPVSVSQNGQNLILDAGRNLGDKAADGTNWLVFFDAKVSSSSAQSVDFFENSATIYYAKNDGGAQNQSISVGTGLTPLRTGKARVPQIREIAP